MIEPKSITTRNELRALQYSLDFSKSEEDETSEIYEFNVFQQLWTINNHVIIALREQSQRSLQTQYYGYAGCVPLRDEFLRILVPDLKKRRESIRAHLKPEFILSQDEAISQAYRDGNALFIGLAVNQDLMLEASHVLFLELQERMREMRVRLVLVEAYKLEYRLICERIGCQRLYNLRKNGAIFYFDVGLLKAPQALGTTLEEIMLYLWHMPNRKSLDLSEKDKKIARLLLEGVTEKCLASELKRYYNIEMSTYTAMDHVQKIRNRFRQRFPELAETKGLKGLICYLDKYRFEVSEVRALSDLTLLSSSEQLEGSYNSSVPTEADEPLG